MADEKAPTGDVQVPRAVHLVIKEVAAVATAPHPWVLMGLCYDFALGLPDDELKDEHLIPLAKAYQVGNDAYRHLTTPAQRHRVNAQEQTALWICCMKDATVSSE